MNGSGRYGWGVALAAVLFGVAIAMLAYSAGVSEGMATAGTDAVRRIRWGWGGGMSLWPLLFIFVWAFMWRGACWRRAYWHGGAHRPLGYGSGPADDEMEQWHRRVHERMKDERPANDPDRRG
jgi:hypothetical protein